MKVAIYTLGCKVNQYETQAMEQELLARGHTLTEFSDEADALYREHLLRHGSQRPEVPAGDPRRPAEAPRRPWWQCAAAIPRPTRTTCGSWGWT